MCLLDSYGRGKLSTMRFAADYEYVSEVVDIVAERNGDPLAHIGIDRNTAAVADRVWLTESGVNILAKGGAAINGTGKIDPSHIAAILLFVAFIQPGHTHSALRVDSHRGEPVFWPCRVIIYAYRSGKGFAIIVRTGKPDTELPGLSLIKYFPLPAQLPGPRRMPARLLAGTAMLRMFAIGSRCSARIVPGMFIASCGGSCSVIMPGMFGTGGGS